MPSPTAIDRLRQSRLAAELTDAQCRVLAESIALRDLRGGEVLVAEGTADNHLYVVDEGVLGVVKNAGSEGELTLFTIGAGDFADELSFIDGNVHYASLIAQGETRVLGLEREKLEALLRLEPEIVYKVMRAIVRAAHQIQSRLSMQSVELTNYIYKQHGRY